MPADGSIEQIRRNLRQHVDDYQRKETEEYTDLTMDQARQQLRIFQDSDAGKVLCTFLGRDNPFMGSSAISEIKAKKGSKGTFMLLDQHIDTEGSNRQFTLMPTNETGVVGTFSSLDAKTGTITDGMFTKNMIVGIVENGRTRIPFQLEIAK